MSPNIEKQLAAAQAAIDGVLIDPQLQATMSAVGYSVSRLREGRVLHDTAQSLSQKQKAEYGDMVAVVQACTVAKANAEAEYMRCGEIARFALRNDQGALKKLGLLTSLPNIHAKRIAQIRQFYANALIDPALLSRLAAFDLPQELLEAGQDLVAAVDASDVARRQNRGDAKHATKERDVALAALERWMRRFRPIARAALQDYPQFLTKLGMS
jgi:hypothetical protein